MMSKWGNTRFAVRAAQVAMYIICLATLSSGKKCAKNIAYDPLNQKFVPTRYVLSLDLSHHASGRYSGQVDIHIKTRDYFKSTALTSLMKTVAPKEAKLIKKSNQFNVVALHAGGNIDIKSVIYKELVSLSKSVNFCTNKDSQTVVVKFDKDIKSGVLSLQFSGPIREDMHGIYRSTFKFGKRDSHFITSSTQQAGARAVFPCIDESKFRAPIKLTLIHDSHLLSLSSSKLLNRAHVEETKKVIEEFDETNPISP